MRIVLEPCLEMQQGAQSAPVALLDQLHCSPPRQIPVVERIVGCQHVEVRRESAGGGEVVDVDERVGGSGGEVVGAGGTHDHRDQRVSANAAAERKKNLKIAVEQQAEYER